MRAAELKAFVAYTSMRKWFYKTFNSFAQAHFYANLNFLTPYATAICPVAQNILFI